MGYSACSSWGFWSFLCTAWTWVSNLVCVAWVWVTTGTCIAWEAAATAVDAVIETVESLIAPVLKILGVFVEAVLAIPVVGRAMKWAFNIAANGAMTVLVNGPSGVIEGAAYFAGIRPRKKLRICTLVLRDEMGIPVVPTSAVVESLNATIAIFDRELNVQLMNSSPFQYVNYLRAAPMLADDSWVQVLPGASPVELLDSGCRGPSGMAMGLEDLGSVGTTRAMTAIQFCSEDIARRAIGYGAPITVFIGRTIDGGRAIGCSAGPATDYVTVARTQLGGAGALLPGFPVFDKITIKLLDVIAHELGHACNLIDHVAAPENLMFAPTGPPPAPQVNTDTHLSNWQRVLIRSARQVVYF